MVPDEADTTTVMMSFAIGSERALKSPVTFLENDDIAKTASATREIDADLLDVLLHLFAAPDWVTAEDLRFRQLSSSRTSIRTR